MSKDASARVRGIFPLRVEEGQGLGQEGIVVVWSKGKKDFVNGKHDESNKRRGYKKA